VANLPPVSTTAVVPVAKFATGELSSAVNSQLQKKL
jgi:hypothetical protein